MEVVMHLRINDVTVSPARVDELREVLSNKALPVVMAQKGCQGLLCAADRATGDCAIVSLWDSKASVQASEQAIASIRSETVDAVNARLNSVVIAEVLREVRLGPTQVGTRTRVVRLTLSAGSADKLVEFYDTEAVPRLEAQQGFLNGRLIREVEHDDRFAAVSHWADASALASSEKNSTGLRDEVTKAIAGASIERVSTAEIILTERTT
jgi:heme-degrading monooxygenase HmoA